MRASDRTLAKYAEAGNIGRGLAGRHSGERRWPWSPGQAEESAVSAGGRLADCPLTLGALGYRRAAIMTADALNAPARYKRLPP